MLLIASYTCLAEANQNVPSSVVTVNGIVVSRKVTHVSLAADTDYLLYNKLVPRVSIVYEHDEGQPIAWQEVMVPMSR